MNCPKCAAEQPDDRTDCVSCGIVFARWQALQDRARVAPDAQITFESSPQRSIPPPLIFVALIIIFVLGAAWTIRSRRARAKSEVSMGDLLNKINQEHIANQNARAEDHARMQRGEPPLDPAWRKQWDWAVAPSTPSDSSGLAYMINQRRKASPTTIPVAVGDVVYREPDPTLRKLEKMGYLTFTKDGEGNTWTRFTPRGRSHARSSWKLEQESGDFTRWRIPVATREIIEVVKEETFGVNTRLLVKFRWVPTDEGRRLGYALAGPFSEAIEVDEREGVGKPRVTTIDTNSRWPAGG